MAGQNSLDEAWKHQRFSGPKKQESTFMRVLKDVSPIAAVLHKGGTVKKTGNYRLKKGERVLTVAQQKKYGIHKGGKRKTNSKKRVACKG